MISKPDRVVVLALETPDGKSTFLRRLSDWFGLASNSHLPR